MQVKLKYITNFGRRFALVIFFCFFLFTTAIAEEQKWSINLKEVDIKVFINQVSEITGENFIIDPGVSGNVTVISESPLSEPEVYELLMTVLKVHGFAASPTGDKSYLIIRQDLAKESTQKVDKFGETSGEEIVSRIIKIKNSSAQELLPLLRPMVARYGYLAASDFSNSLIISDHASNIKKIERIIEDLDISENPEMEIIPLKEAWVGNVAAMIQELAFVKQQDGNKFRSLRIVANEYNNSLILKGDERERKIVRNIISRLDKPSLETSGIQVIYLKYADASDIAEILKTLIAGGSISTAQNNDSKSGVNVVSGNNENISIQADKSLNALVIKADPGTINEIRGVVKNLDIKRTQILIEAAIVETTGDLTNQLGIQLGGGDAATDLSLGATSFTNAGVDLTTILKGLSAPGSSALGDGLTIGLGSEDKFSALIQALSKNVNANLLSTPSVTTLDNQEAKILVGQNVPFITGSYSNNSGGTDPFTTIQRQDIGVTLKVTPHIYKDDSVRMDVEQEVSSLLESNSGASDIITNKREIKTSILSANKQVIAIGGLIQDDLTKTESKVPFLGDIPLLGYLFKSKKDTVVKRNLFVFLRPTILHSDVEIAGDVKKKYNGIYELKLNDEKFENKVKEKLPPAIEEVFDKNYSPSAGDAGQCSPAATWSDPDGGSIEYTPIVSPNYRDVGEYVNE